MEGPAVLVPAIGAAILLALLLRAHNPVLTTLVVGPLFLILVGALLHVTHLYVMGAMILGVCAISWVLARFSLRGLAVSRDVPTPLATGDTADCVLELQNNDRLPKFLLRVDLGLPAGLRADRRIFLVPALWPRQHLRLETRAHADRRGRYALGPVEIGAGDPLGIFHRVRQLPAPAEVLVTPPIRALSLADLLGETAYGATSPRHSLLAGHGLDFHSLREYVDGDDLRRVDWKTTARLGKLVVTEYEPTVVGDLVLLLDTRPAGEDPAAALDLCVIAAASLIARVLDDGGQVHLHAGRGETPEELSARGPDAIPLFLEMLAAVEAGSVPPARLAEGARPGTTTVLLSAAADEALLAGALALGGHGEPVALLVDAEACLNPGRRMSSGKLRASGDALRQYGLSVGILGPSSGISD